MTDFTNLNLSKSTLNDLHRLGFTKTTDIQQKTIPLLLNKKDVVVKSHTGSGKTLCFVIPITEEITSRNRQKKNGQVNDDTQHTDTSIPYVIALIITPTRELALQINEILHQFNVKSCACIGGSDLQIDFKGINVVVGTPGRLFEVIKSGPALFGKMNMLVLDESDELISLGFNEKVLDIISLLPKKRCTSLFSATISEGVHKLSLSLLRNPVNIQGESLSTPQELRLHYLEIRPEDKLPYTLSLIEGKKSIVFFSTCNQVDFFYTLMKKFYNRKILKIHGKMRQEERSSVYKDFEGQVILLCTDVAARGIDFKDIEVIVHFDVPKDHNAIIHRSGRTARNGKEGEAVLFIMPNEITYLDYLKIKNVEIGPREDVKLTVCNLRHLMDETTLDLSVKAFVAYIRSYKEHSLNYILDFATLDYDSLAELFMLEKIPGMFELKSVEFKKFPKPKPNENKEIASKRRLDKKRTGKNKDKNVVNKRIDNKNIDNKNIVNKNLPAVRKSKQKHTQKRIKSKKDCKRKK